MRLLSRQQISVLQALEHRRLGVLEVHANSAAALMYRGCIIYHAERSGYITYQITKEGQTMLDMQLAIDKSSKTFGSVRKGIMNTKKKGKGRAKSVKKKVSARVRQRTKLKAVA